MKRWKALAVDDSATVRAHLKQVLSAQMECICMPDAESALKYALESRPDIIISDVIMGEMDGYELCKRIRAAPLLKDVPFILLTAQNDADARAIGLEEGADDYIAKPFNARELLARASSLLRLQDARQEIVAQKEILSRSHQELLTAQRQLLESEKVATLGSIAAGVAHELNNPLAFVLSGVDQMASLAEDLLSEKPLSKEEKKALLADVDEIRSEVAQGADRIRSVMHDLRLLGSPDEDSTHALDVSDEIERALVIAHDQLTGIEIVRELHHQGTLRARAGYLTQLMLNLISNSAQALNQRPNPRITIRTRMMTDSRAAKLEVSVEDNGAGIAPETLPRIFDPFFTTQFAGKGKGLGLPVCANLIKRLGGSTTVESTLGKGTTLRFWLPQEGRDITGFERSHSNKS